MKTKTPLDTLSDFMSLCAFFDIRQNEGLGILDRLYRLTAQVASDGLIGAFRNAEFIEKHVGWHGKPGELVTGLLFTDFLYMHHDKKSKKTYYAVSYWDSLEHVYCPEVEG